MSAVATLATAIAAAAGGVMAYRFIQNRQRILKNVINDIRNERTSAKKARVIDYEQDPASGVYKPKD